MTKDTNLTAWIRAKNHAFDEAMSGILDLRHILLHVLAAAFAASMYLAGREGIQSHPEPVQGKTTNKLLLHHLKILMTYLDERIEPSVIERVLQITQPAVVIQSLCEHISIRENATLDHPYW